MNSEMTIKNDRIQWLDHDETLKAFLKPKFHQKKIMATSWLSAAIGVIHYKISEI